MVDEKSKGFSKFPQQIIFSGPSFDDGSMDVKDFAPFLIAFAKLCEETHFHLTGEKEKVTVRAKADIRKGSFGFMLDIIILAKTTSDFFEENLDVISLLFLLYEYFNIIIKIGWKEATKEKGGENILLEREIEEKKTISILGIVYNKTIERKTRELFAPLKGKIISKLTFRNPKSKENDCEINENGIRNLGAPDEEEEEEKEKKTEIKPSQNFYWHQVARDKTSSNIDRGIIKKISDKSVKVIFKDITMKEKMLNDALFQKTYVVKVEVTCVAEQPELYKIISVDGIKESAPQAGSLI